MVSLGAALNVESLLLRVEGCRREGIVATCHASLENASLREGRVAATTPFMDRPPMRVVIADGHTVSSAPDLVRPPKLSDTEAG